MMMSQRLRNTWTPQPNTLEGQREIRELIERGQRRGWIGLAPKPVPFRTPQGKMKGYWDQFYR